MTQSNTASQPNPGTLFDSINAYQRTAAIRSAIELDLFSAIAEGKRTAAQLAARCKASERGIRMLCDFLVCHGMLNKRAGSYELTVDSATFLDRKSPAYCGGMVDFLLDPQMLGHFDRLTDAVRKGGTAAADEGTVSAENPVWVKFARAMAPMMFPAGQKMAQILNGNSTTKIKVLDIAAGHGMFGIAMGMANPNAKIVATDWAGVLDVAKENARRFGVADRFSTIPGSAFDVDFGSGYDLILLPNFLHHFDVPTCQKLLKKVHAALAPNGRAAAVEFVPNDDRVTPPPAATFALIMLATTPSGDAYTYAELAGMFKAAGFSNCEYHSMDPLIQAMAVAGK